MLISFFVLCGIYVMLIEVHPKTNPSMTFRFLSSVLVLLLCFSHRCLPKNAVASARADRDSNAGAEQKSRFTDGFGMYTWVCACSGRRAAVRARAETAFTSIL